MSRLPPALRWPAFWESIFPLPPPVPGHTDARVAAAQRIIDHAVQLHGGMGVIEGTAVERLYREIRPLRIYEGTTEIQKLIIAKGILAGRVVS